MSDDTSGPPAPSAPKLPDIETPSADDVLEGVPSKDEVIEEARSADEVIEQQPSVDELLRRETPTPPESQGH